ncbi:hypothetical protein [Rhodococcus sp. ACPA4]|nr:hypothetical protein [Rhodococcus sp. ACPA4]
MLTNKTLTKRLPLQQLDGNYRYTPLPVIRDITAPPLTVDTHH